MSIQQINVSGTYSFVSLDTTLLFNDSSINVSKNPIETYKLMIEHYLKIANHLYINDILPLETDNIHLFRKEISLNLIILGVVSAVETYCRSIITKILLLDNHLKQKAWESRVCYAAAITHKKILLPEALLEEATFISFDNISKTITSHLPFSLSNSNLKDLGKEFDKVCNLRNCIVHRSSKLGSKNAIKLGFDLHKEALEKPIVIDYSLLQDMTTICDNFVYALNNELFHQVLHNIKGRNQTNALTKIEFKKYFNTFSGQHMSLNDVYQNHYLVYFT